MPIQVYEKAAGRKQRRSSSSSAEIGYLIFGTTDDQAAGAALQAAVPPLYQGLVLDSIEVELVSDCDALGGIFDGRVSYCTKERKEQKDEQNQQQETGDAPVFTVAISGGTAHIELALETVYQKTVSGGVPVDCKNMIGVQDGVPAGCDVPEVEFTWTEQHFLPTSAVTTAWLRKVRRLYGRTNDATFRGEPKDAVKFMGAAGSKRGDKDWDFTFTFVSGEHEDVELEGFSEDAPKKAFEYLWISRTQAEDTAGEKHAMAPRPVAVYVNRVLKRGDFSELGIGTDELVL